MSKIGITERGDAALNFDWTSWVKDGNPTILITKNPRVLYEYIESNLQIPTNRLIVHCVITGMGGTVIEPNVPSPDESLEYYKLFCKKLGNEKVVLRVDPIVPTDKGIKTALSVINQCQSRLRISFLDMYNHVKDRFIQNGIKLPYSSFHASIHLRRAIVVKTQEHVKNVEICGEPDMKCTGCVSEKDIELLKINAISSIFSKQRKTCHCLANKIELLKQRKQCKHGCLYCYWKN